MIAILRKCRRCDLWRSVDVFKPLGKLCDDCIKSGMGQYSRVARIAVSRGIVLLPKARDALRELATA